MTPKLTTFESPAAATNDEAPGAPKRKRRTKAEMEAARAAEAEPVVAAPAVPATPVAPATTKADKKTPLPPPVALACRMSPELARRIKGKFRVSIPIPKDDTIRDVAVGARLLLREWIGAATGRADLVRVVAVGLDDGEEGYADRCTVERSWCWATGKLDDDLAFLGLTIVADHFPSIGY
jgi:hypothetical protein